MRSLILHVTSKCNFNCLYCYKDINNNEVKEMDTRQVFQSIERLCNYGLRTICISGGEPFLRSDIIEILDLCSNLRINTYIFTNGSKLNSFFPALPRSIRLCISLDGIEPLFHDKTRGNFDLVFSNVMESYRRGFKIEICTTITSYNIHHLPDLISYFEELNIPVYLTEVSNEGKAKACPGAFIGYDELASLLRKYDLFRCFNESRRLRNPQSSQICNCGLDELFVSEEGYVYPCPHLAYPDFRAGNILSDEICSIVKNLRRTRKKIFLTRKESKCGVCPLENQCGGGCIARSFLHSGKYFSDPLCGLYVAESQKTWEEVDGRK